ncbi:MAG: molybdopterin molybdotransferase MoeA [Bacteroidia bacterium]|nr:molybdopterin molybdotransferase MoeA [Bacteroidia bacterium]
MITVAEATDIVLSHLYQPQAISLPLDQCPGKILQEDIKADRDFPPFNRVMMDGIAIDYASWEKGIRSFPISATGAAGSPQLKLDKAEACIEIMTGAIMPLNTDTIIRYEDLEIKDGVATVMDIEIEKGQNVHLQGFDRKSGDVIVYKGSAISPAEIGVAASIGKESLLVSSLPKTIIISTGDELVAVGDSPLPHQIRQSNTHKLRAVLKAWGIEADLTHLPDDQQLIESKLREFASRYELIIVSGGVSKGKFDFLPKSLDALGVEKYFHRVKQRPGKPFWFGAIPGGPTVFALPGNPVSSFVCFMRYFQPWLRASLGQAPFAPFYAELAAPIYFEPDLTYFAQVLLSYNREGKVIAHPVEGHGSGDLANLVNASAFIELPQGKDEFEVGEVYGVIKFRWG